MKRTHSWGRAGSGHPPLRRMPAGRALLGGAGLVLYFSALAVLSQVEAILSGRSANPAAFDLTLTFHSQVGVNPLLDGSPGYIKQALGQLGVALLLHGHSPWWNPYAGLGSPLATDLQSAVFYPFSLIVYGLHLGGARVDLVALADMAIAGLTMYWLVLELGIGRFGALVAGTAFCLAGSFAWLGTDIGDVMAWAPASLAFTVRLLRPNKRSRAPDIIGLGLVTAVQILGGFPESLALQVVLLTLPLAVARLVRIRGFRRQVRALGAVVAGFVFGFLLTAFFWVPFITALPAENLWNHPGRSLLHPPGWADLVLFVPFAFGHWFNTAMLSVIDWYQLGGYLGIVATWLAAVAIFRGWKSRWDVVVPLAVSVALAVLLIGGLPPLNQLTQLRDLNRLPFARLTTAELEVAVAVLAGLAVQLRVNWKSWLGATMSCGLGIWLLVDLAPRGVAGRRDLAFAVICLTTAVVGIPVLEGAARLAHRHSARGLLGLAGPGLALVLVAVELLTLSNLDYRGLPSATGPSLSRPPAWVNYVKNHLDGGRLYAANDLLSPNYSGDFGIEDLSFEDAVEPRATDAFVQSQVDPGNPNSLAFLGNPMQLTLPQHLGGLELSGVTLLALPDPGCLPGCAHLALRFLDKAAGVGVFAVPDPQPMAWLPSRVTPGTRVPSDPLRAVSVDAALHETYQGGAVAKLVRSTTRCLKVSVRARRNRLLVLRQVKFPGWRTSVNRKPARLLTVDGVFQGVMVPRGTSTVRISYTPPGLHPSELLALLAALWALVSLVLAAWGHRRAGPRSRGAARPYRSHNMPRSRSPRSSTTPSG